MVANEGRSKMVICSVLHHKAKVHIMKDILSIERVVGFVLRKLLYQILDEIDL